jgi:hypothetical protein
VGTLNGSRFRIPEGPCIRILVGIVENLIVLWIIRRTVVGIFVIIRGQSMLKAAGNGSLLIITGVATVKLVGVARTVQSGVRTPKEEDLVMEVLEEIMGRTLRQPPSPLEVAVPIIWKELMILMAQSVPVEAILRMVLVLVHILERADMVWTVMSRLMVKIRIEAEVLLSQMAHGPLLLLTATEVDTVPRILALEIPLGDQPQPLLLRRGHA